MAGWWKTRTLRRLKKEYDRLCAKVYKEIMIDCPEHGERVEENVRSVVDYWSNKEEDLRLLAEEASPEDLRLVAALCSMASPLVLANIRTYTRETTKFLASIRRIANWKSEADAGRVLLAYHAYALRGIDRPQLFSSVRTKMVELSQEIRVLSQKGSLKASGS